MCWLCWTCAGAHACRFYVLRLLFVCCCGCCCCTTIHIYIYSWNCLVVGTRKNHNDDATRCWRLLVCALVLPGKSRQRRRRRLMHAERDLLRDRVMCIYDVCNWWLQQKQHVHSQTNLQNQQRQQPATPTASERRNCRTNTHYFNINIFVSIPRIRRTQTWLYIKHICTVHACMPKRNRPNILHVWIVLCCGATVFATVRLCSKLTSMVLYVLSEESDITRIKYYMRCDAAVYTTMHISNTTHSLLVCTNNFEFLSDSMRVEEQ